MVRPKSGVVKVKFQELGGYVQHQENNTQWLLINDCWWKRTVKDGVPKNNLEYLYDTNQIMMKPWELQKKSIEGHS